MADVAHKIIIIGCFLEHNHIVAVDCSGFSTIIIGGSNFVGDHCDITGLAGGIRDPVANYGVNGRVDNTVVLGGCSCGCFCINRKSGDCCVQSFNRSCVQKGSGINLRQSGCFFNLLGGRIGHVFTNVFVVAQVVACVGVRVVIALVAGFVCADVSISEGQGVTVIVVECRSDCGNFAIIVISVTGCTGAVESFHVVVNVIKTAGHGVQVLIVNITLQVQLIFSRQHIICFHSQIINGIISSSSVNSHIHKVLSPGHVISIVGLLIQRLGYIQLKHRKICCGGITVHVGPFGIRTVNSIGVIVIHNHTVELVVTNS